MSSSNSENKKTSEEISSEVAKVSPQEKIDNLVACGNFLLESAFDGGGSEKYSDLCNQIVQRTNAEAAFLVIVNGANGSGYASQIVGGVNLIADMAGMLETIASQLRVDAAKARIGE